MNNTRPEVSIIIPCYNEQKTIRFLLEAIHLQEYPISKIEVIIADGLSTDQTRDVVDAFQNMHPELNLKIVDNPTRKIPSGLNRAIENAHGSIIVRLDAHSIPNPEYIGRSVQDLQDNLGDNIGGVWEIRAGSDNWQAQSIAIAASHFLGVGDARYRYTDKAQEVDTVPFGAFYRSMVDRIGYYDESLLTNEDYELNTRLRKSGGKIWLDPKIRSIYFARQTFKELARQYWRYGYWKAQMLRKHPGSLRLRQVLPPGFLLGLVVLLFLSILVNNFFWGILLAVILIYCTVLLLAGTQMSVRYRKLFFIVGVPISIAAMHLSWGSAFLWGFVHRRNNAPKG